MTDPEDPASYPIATLTWMLFYEQGDHPDRQAAIRDFVTWAMSDEGQAMAEEINYIPLPDTLRERVVAASERIQ